MRVLEKENRREVADLLVELRPAACRMAQASTEKLKQTEPAKNKRVASAHKL